MRLNELTAAIRYMLAPHDQLYAISVILDDGHIYRVHIKGPNAGDLV